MTKQKNRLAEDALNLEERSLDELERAPLCDADSQDEAEVTSEDVQKPHISRRCDSSHRELLNNPFPADE